MKHIELNTLFDLQVKAMGIEVGCVVQVMYLPLKSDYAGSGVTIASSMYKSVGTCQKVTLIDTLNRGILLTDGYTYPVTCLQLKIALTKPPIKCEINGNHYEIYNNRTVTLGSHKMYCDELETIVEKLKTIYDPQTRHLTP